MVYQITLFGPASVVSASSSCSSQGGVGEVKFVGTVAPVGSEGTASRVTVAVAQRPMVFGNDGNYDGHQRFLEVEVVAKTCVPATHDCRRRKKATLWR